MKWLVCFAGILVVLIAVNADVSHIGKCTDRSIVATVVLH